MTILEKIRGLWAKLCSFKLEVALVVVLTSLAMTSFFLPQFAPLIRQLIFIPVVLASLMLAWERATAFTVLGLTLVLVLSQAQWANYESREMIELIIWGATLACTSAIIGLFSAQKEQELSNKIQSQNEIANTDALTSLHNRRYFDEALRKSLRTNARTGQKFALLMIDIDHFKSANDLHGHDVGDGVLKRVAIVIQRTVRKSDLVCRYGGEEFACIIQTDTQQECEMIAEKLRSHVAAMNLSKIVSGLKVTVSIGATLCDENDTEASIVKRADQAMYQAKNGGRNRVYFKARSSKPNEVVKKEVHTIESSLFENAQLFVDEHDAITGLVFVKIFQSELQRRVFECNRYGLNMIALVFTIPSIESNSNDPREVGGVLKRAADTIVDSVREVDLATWYSSNSFVLLLPNTDLDGSRIVADRIKQNLMEMFVTDATETIEIIQKYVQLQDAEPADEYIERLDEAAKTALHVASAGSFPMLGDSTFPLLGDSTQTAN